MNSQKNNPQNDSTPDGLQTPAPKVTESAAEERHQRRVAAAGNEEGTSLEFGPDAMDFDNLDDLADILTDQLVNEKNANSIKKVKKYPAYKLLKGVPEEYFDLCFAYLESCAKMNDVNVDAVVNHIRSPDELVVYAKNHAKNRNSLCPKNENRGLRPYITLSQKAQENIENNEVKNAEHLQQAITTTQNVKITKWFNCGVLNRPEEWLLSDDTLGAWKGLYLAAWGNDVDLHFHNCLRAFQSEEYQNLSVF